MIIKLYGVRGSLPAPMLNRDFRLRLKEVLTLAIEQNLKSTSDIESFIDALPDYLSFTTGGDTTCVTVREDDD